MLKHIGLTITDSNEIENFYQDLLDFKLQRNFILSKELNQKIFGFYEEVPVYLMTNSNIDIELFVTKLPFRKNYSHFCIEVDNREDFIKKAKNKNYPCIVIERDGTSNLMFIKDKFGNLFEIKNKTQNSPEE